MKKYTNSVIALFICMLILTPSTVYAEELASMPTFSVIQPITGAALPNENLSASLVTRLNTYLADNLNNGNIDIQKFNDILSSGMVSENAFFANSVFVGDSLTVGFSEYCRTQDSIASDSTYFLAPMEKGVYFSSQFWAIYSQSTTARKPKQQEQEAAIHTHRQKQGENECAHTCAQLLFHSYTSSVEFSAYFR